MDNAIYFNIDNSSDNLPLNDYLTIPISRFPIFPFQLRFQYAANHDINLLIENLLLSWMQNARAGRGECSEWTKDIYGPKPKMLEGSGSATPTCPVGGNAFDLSNYQLAGQTKLTDDEVKICTRRCYEGPAKLALYYL